MNVMNENMQSTERKVRGTNLTISQWKDMERSVNETFSETFSKIWIQNTLTGGVSITGFYREPSASRPISNYTFFVSRNFGNFQTENVIRFIRSRIT